MSRLRFTLRVSRGDPLTNTSPPSLSKSPVTMDMVVVIPAPLGPRRPYVSPSPMLNPTPFTATRSPKALRKSRQTSTGLLERDGGEVLVSGSPLDTRSVNLKRDIGLVPQDVAVYPDLTARENLVFFGRLYGMSGSALSPRVDEVLETVGLRDRADDRTDEYSGGMRRRLNIGVGLLHSPRILILDEPTVGVDPQSRNAILESIERLSVEGLAVLYTTHYMEEAERLCDRVGIIDGGRLVAEGTRRELVELIGGHDRVRLLATGDLEAAVTAVLSMEGVEQADVRDGGMELVAAQAGQLLNGILAVLTEAGVSVSSVRVEELNLEAEFLHLTGKALRD